MNDLVAAQIASLEASARRLRVMAEVWEARGDSQLAADIARREAKLDEARAAELERRP